MMQAYTDEMYYINDYLKGRKPVITTGFHFMPGPPASLLTAIHSTV